jgi:hypothetical protein
MNAYIRGSSHGGGSVWKVKGKGEGQKWICGWDRRAPL